MMQYIKTVLLTFTVCLLFILINSIPVSARDDGQNGEGEQSKPPIDEQIKKYLNRHGIVRFGINTDLVVTNEHDTGFGFGMRLPKKAFAPVIELTTSVNFWGASNDTLDVTLFGIEESLTIHKKPSQSTEIFSGISGGYYGKITTQDIITDGRKHTYEIQQNMFSAYVTIGFVYKLNEDQSVFAQLKHGITRDSEEVHFLGGIYFH